MKSEELVTEFLDWTRTQQIKTHPQLSLTSNNNEQGYTIKLLEQNELTIIPEDTTVASIPKQACLSHRTSTRLPQDIDLDRVPISHQPIIRLTVHLLHELSLSSRSKWYPYLNLITHPPDPILIHLRIEEQAEIEAWIRGTEIERLIAQNRILSLSQLRAIYEGLALSQSWEEFVKGYTIVSSRAFQIDNYHSLGLVPIADLYDHSDQPDVQLVSQDLVCDQCGSIGECVHDNPCIGLVNQKDEYLDTVELVSIHPLIGSSKPTIVYNTYGNLSNSRLMTEYGFMIQGNQYDRLYFNNTEIVDLKDDQALKTTFQALIKAGLFTSNDDETDQTLVGDVDEDSDGASLYLDSHARLSPLLWLSIVYRTYDHHHQTPAIEYISTLFERQSSSLGNLDRPCTSSEHHLSRISGLVHTLCEHKLSLYCLPNKSIDELLTIKDEIMDSINGGTGIDEISLGLAIEYNCSERVLLETCIEIWDQFRSF
ncbi:hypothetical protein Pst134EA_021247 [Puccinia striiformis f. sp. tritici]|uniref:hypothetical protein n=1 Tax=Puccinia striiformis f. sp. tritici TaxID=168172 RepID=UPI002008E68D|nr:hypothetical protein Pst134EA_021247 [Puccinia striiformis f. sp. tritici]KAH9457364.1 hypothetical protein Pst134EA_021247 [Puccinia striiformis f. sp. tritici]